MLQDGHLRVAIVRCSLERQDTTHHTSILKRLYISRLSKFLLHSIRSFRRVDHTFGRFDRTGSESLFHLCSYSLLFSIHASSLSFTLSSLLQPNRFTYTPPLSTITSHIITLIKQLHLKESRAPQPQSPCPFQDQTNLHYLQKH